MEDDIELDMAKIFGASEARDQRFGVYVPNKDKNGFAIPQDPWVEKTLVLFSRICGGATAMPPVKGAWLNEKSGHLVIEEPVLVYVYFESLSFQRGLNEIVDLVHQIGRETNQGQMAVEFNQSLILIDMA